MGANTVVRTPAPPPAPGESDSRADRRARVLAAVASMVAVTLWASAFVGIRRAGRDLSAGPLSLGRLAVGALALGAFMLIRREGLPSRRTWVGISMIGLVWFAVYNIVLNEAERRIDAGTAAMIIAIGPLLIALLAGWLLREGFPARLLIGSGIAFAGSLVIGLATYGRAPRPDGERCWH